MKKILFFVLLLLSSLGAAAYCRVDTVYNYTYPDNGAIREDVNRRICTYTTDSLVATDEYQVFDAAISAYVRQSKVISQYNAARKLVFQSSQAYSTSANNWVDAGRRYYSYSPAGFLIKDSSSYAGTPTWTKGPRFTYTVNVDGKPVVTLREVWDFASGGFVPTSRTTSKYNGLQLVADTARYYNTSISAFENGSIREYSRNGFGTVIQELLYFWDAATSSYYTKSRDSYNVTGANFVTFQSNEQKAGPTSPWVYKTKAFQRYDMVNMVLLERKDLKYDAGTGVWDTIEKTTYTYNSSYDLISKDIYSFDKDLQEYTTRDQTVYRCASTTVGIEDVQDGKTFSAYPNPVSTGFITINSLGKAHYALVDLRGELVKQGNLSIGENRVQLESLLSGIYILKVGNQSQKVVIQ